MKAADVYAVLRAELGPWFRAEGFQRAKGPLAWCRARGSAHTVVWCHVSHDAWDDYAGLRFVVEFQRSADPHPGTLRSRRARFAQLLSVDARAELLALQNAVIASLRPPPDDHYVLHVSDQVTHRYRNKFEPVTTPYTDRDDVWLRYATPADVERWARFIRAHLPSCVATADAWQLPT